MGNASIRENRICHGAYADLKSQLRPCRSFQRCRGLASFLMRFQLAVDTELTGAENQRGVGGLEKVGKVKDIREVKYFEKGEWYVESENERGDEGVGASSRSHTYVLVAHVPVGSLSVGHDLPHDNAEAPDI